MESSTSALGKVGTLLLGVFLIYLASATFIGSVFPWGGQPFSFDGGKIMESVILLVIGTVLIIGATGEFLGFIIRKKVAEKVKEKEEEEDRRFP